MNVSFIDGLSRKYIDIVKWFSVIVSTLFLVAAVVVFSRSITWPNHPVLDAAAVGGDFKPDPKSLLDDKLTGIIINSACNDSYVNADNSMSEFKNFLDEFKKSGMKNSINGTYCLQQIVESEGVKKDQIGEWYKFYTSFSDSYSGKYIIANAVDLTASAYAKKYEENLSLQRNFSFNYIGGGIALSCFMLFVMSCGLLILVKIENNTRR